MDYACNDHLCVCGWAGGGGVSAVLGRGEEVEEVDQAFRCASYGGVDLSWRWGLNEETEWGGYREIDVRCSMTASIRLDMCLAKVCDKTSPKT